MKEPMKIAFFGTPSIAVHVLEELEKENILPELIVTNPDKPHGRGLQLAETPVKKWALEKSISVIEPTTFNEPSSLGRLTSEKWDLFVVVAYGSILPKWLIDIPKYGTLNVHPSLLPKLRGASPIRTSILQDFKDAGVTIMLMDEKLDHGPILAQEHAPTLETPVAGQVFDEILARQGGRLLAQVIANLQEGSIIPKEQDHTEATFSKKITKEMGQLQIDPFDLPTGKEAREAYLKICAFDGWPGTFFFFQGKRIKIASAKLHTDKLQIERIIPEGKKEMDFDTFIKNAQRQ